MAKLIGGIVGALAALAAIALWCAVYIGIPVLAFIALWKYTMGG